LISAETYTGEFVCGSVRFPGRIICHVRCSSRQRDSLWDTVHTKCIQMNTRPIFLFLLL
jgi:hypothetical protein